MQKKLVSGLLNSNNQTIENIPHDKPSRLENDRDSVSSNTNENTHVPQKNQSEDDDNTPIKKPINVKPLQFESFDDAKTHNEVHNDISLIRDVPLGITVELGRTNKKVSEILDFGPGTVIELDKLVGESLDILVNGKKIAKGEVVVVDENYGIRITDILVHQNTLAKI